MRLDIVTPEKRLLSADATAVQIPGSEGDMTVMADHAPLITTLRPGVLVVDAADGSQSFAVTGGFAEVTAESTSVLAEQAMPVAEMTQEILDALVAEADAARKAAPPELADLTAKVLADMVALGEALGLSAKQPGH